MGFKDPWFSEGKQSPLDFERRMYEQTGNPIHVWRAWQMCSDLMRAGVYRCDSLPEWILDYIDRIAATLQERLSESWGKNPDRSQLATVLMDVIGVVPAGRGVTSNALSENRRQHRDLSLASAVRVELRDRPRSLEQVFADVADRETETRRFGETIGIETVKRAWYSWRGFLDEYLASVDHDESSA